MSFQEKAHRWFRHRPMVGTRLNDYQADKRWPDLVDRVQALGLTDWDDLEEVLHYLREDLKLSVRAPHPSSAGRWEKKLARDPTR